MIGITRNLSSCKSCLFLQCWFLKCSSDFRKCNSYFDLLGFFWPYSAKTSSNPILMKYSPVVLILGKFFHSSSIFQNHPKKVIIFVWIEKCWNFQQTYSSHFFLKQSLRYNLSFQISAKKRRSIYFLVFDLFVCK